MNLSMKTLKIIAIKQKDGLRFFNAIIPFEYISIIDPNFCTNKEIRQILFSEDGKYFCWVDSNDLYLVDIDDYIRQNNYLSNVLELTYKIKLNHKNIRHATISPLSTYLVIWRDFNPQTNKKNLQIYNIKSNKLVHSYTSARQNYGEISWTKDEKCFAKFIDNNNNIVGFYNPPPSDNIVTKTSPNMIINSYALSPRVSQTYIATFTKGAKGQPCQIKLLQFPDFIVNQYPGKNMFNGDECSFYWDSTGRCVLALLTCQVDRTNESYYGNQSVFLFSVRKDGFSISLSLEMPIYALTWGALPDKTSLNNNPNANDNTDTTRRSTGVKPKPATDYFVVIYGKMPSKASLFNDYGEIVFDFGTGNRNGCDFNPQGQLLALTGSGNVQGLLEFWETYHDDVNNCKLITKLNFNKLIPTRFEWCPDGQHMLVATTSPRLRIDNGFYLYHYTGTMIFRSEEIIELTDIKWRPPASDCKFPPFKIDYRIVKSTMDKSLSQEAHTHVNEKPKLYVPPHERNSNFVSSIPPFTPKGKSSEPKSLVVGTKDASKRARNIRKKLKQILSLKWQLKSGKVLDKTLLDKIATEDALLKELDELDISENEGE